ncbi:MAG: ABC transporter permease, partial [Vicinamibacteria bacterium]
MTLYDALLHLYPKSFRLEYGEEMGRMFAERRGGAAGAVALVSLWAETLLDVIPNAVLVHGDILRQDTRFTLQALGRAPGFTATAILMAALGIGATTAAFSVTDRVLIRPLPFPDSERLVKVWQSTPGYSRFEPSPAHLRDWKAMNTAFEDLGAYTSTSMNLVGDGEPMRISGASVTFNLMPILGVPPFLGRSFSAEDDREGAAGSVLLSYGFWRDAFGGREDAVGKNVRLDEATYTVIGVMPRDFTFPDRATRLWVPFRFDSSSFEDRTNTYLRLVGRLKPQMTLAGARADMKLVTSRLKAANPKDNDATVVLLSDDVPSQARLLLIALFGASVCVLLIACTNLASLLIARSLNRRK